MFKSKSIDSGESISELLDTVWPLFAANRKSINPVLEAWAEGWMESRYVPVKSGEGSWKRRA